jgi:hypothetical protein
MGRTGFGEGGGRLAQERDDGKEFIPKHVSPVWIPQSAVHAALEKIQL